MQHIVIITAVYPPEPVVSARMACDLAASLVSQSFSVTVLCPQPSRPIGANYDIYQGKTKPVVSYEEGVKVVRLPSFTSPASRLISRLWESWSFGWHVSQYLASLAHQPNVMYVNAWPLLAQAFICQYACFHGIPFVLQIMDIYPESLVSKLPDIMQLFVTKPLLALDSWVSRSATKVVVISDNMREAYTNNRRIPDDKIVTIPTWQDDSIFAELPERESVCRRYGIPSDLFTFLYLGNIGPVAGVDFLVRAFQETNIENAQLLIIGDGSAKASCVDLVKKLNAKNIHFISDPDAANVPVLQSMAHVCMLPLKKGIGYSSIPSKLHAYLFSAKPIIATVDHDCDTARVIRQARCGWVGASEDLSWLTVKIKDIAEHPIGSLEQIGQCGKNYGLRHFSKTQGVKNLSDIIKKAILSNVE